MPSFAKAAVEPSSNPLIGLWRDHSGPSPLADLLQHHRARAAQILSTEMPAKITHIRALLATESDPSSILWTGHFNEGDFVHPRMIQPDHVSRLLAQPDGLAKLNEADLREGERVVLPSEMTRANLGPEGDEATESDEGVGIQEVGNVETGVGAGSHWFEVVPRNKVQAEMVTLATKEHEDLHVLVQDLRVWLELEIPLIEDGNSFGAEVQNHLIRELETAYKKSNGFINSSRQHHTDRIKLVTGWAKFPNIMDYPAAITNSDRFDHFIARSYFRSLLMVYGGLLTKFQKNWEKVINPKGSGNGSAGGVY